MLLRHCVCIAEAGAYYAWNTAGLLLMLALAFWFYKVKRAVGPAKFIAFVAALTYALCLIMRWVYYLLASTIIFQYWPVCDDHQT